MSGQLWGGERALKDKELQASQAARLKAAVEKLMAAPEGRAFLRWLLARCRCFEAQAPAFSASPLAERLIFAEGAREVGMEVLRLLEAAGSAHFANLLLTREEDDEPDGKPDGCPDGKFRVFSGRHG